MRFNEEYKKGLNGENIVIDWFITGKWQVNDLRNIPYWRRKDIDIQVIKDNRAFYFEIKSQKRIATHNQIVIEMLDLEHNKEGWFYYSEADYFIFVNPIEEIGYIISAFALKEYIDTHNFTEELNGYSNCIVLYLNLDEMKGIFQKVILKGGKDE